MRHGDSGVWGPCASVSDNSVADSCRSDILLCDVVVESERTGVGRREERTGPLFVRGGDNDPTIPNPSSVSPCVFLSDSPCNALGMPAASRKARTCCA